MTLSPKTTISNSPPSTNRLRMFLLGLLLAFESRAQIPMTPYGAGFAFEVLEGTSSHDAIEVRRSLGPRELTFLLFLLARHTVARRAVAACRMAPAEAALDSAARSMQLLTMGVRSVGRGSL